MLHHPDSYAGIFLLNFFRPQGQGGQPFSLEVAAGTEQFDPLRRQRGEVAWPPAALIIAAVSSIVSGRRYGDGLPLTLRPVQ
jgi:hypothetical protein